MSKVADWLFTKYVEPMEQEFFSRHGRWPEGEEESAIWQKAFEKSEADQEGRADAARKENP